VKTKTLYKLGIDLAMIVLFLITMACRLTGSTIHEFLGVFLAILFCFHNIIYWRWYIALFKGRYPPLRIFHTAINLLLFLIMLVLLTSGAMLSHTLIGFMDLKGGLSARKLHILSTYWGFILMSIHLGIHWEMIMSVAHQIAQVAYPNRSRTFHLKFLALVIAIYGVFASFRLEIGSKLILNYAFDFWDYDKSPLFFFLDYLSVMEMYACLAYYTARRLHQFSTPF